MAGLGLKFKYAAFVTGVPSVHTIHRPLANGIVQQLQVVVRKAVVAAMMP